MIDNVHHRGVVWLLAQPMRAEPAAAAGDSAEAAQILTAAEHEYPEREFRWPLATRRLGQARKAVGGRPG